MTLTFSSTMASLYVDTFSLLHYHTTIGMFHMCQYEGDRLNLFLHFCNYRQSIIAYFIIPSTFSLRASSPLEHYRRTEGWTKFFTPCSLSYFFSLSAQGPTRRHNSTGLAKLWGGWPIEQEIYCVKCSYTMLLRTHKTGTLCPFKEFCLN